MKSKLLPIGFIALILGFTTFILLASGIVGDYQSGKAGEKETTGINGAMEYLHKIQKNQVSGKIDAADVLQAREQARQMHFKAGNELGLNWEEMGPDNAPGRVRAIIFDQNDASGQTLITAGVTGGLWKTTNLGATWNKINHQTENLYITCMKQASDGTIYAGTGEAFCTNDYTYYGGLVGQGIYKSTDQENFSLIEETKPEVTEVPDTLNWAYVNELAIDPTSQRIYAATNTGLWYAPQGGAGWQKADLYNYDTVIFDITLSIDSVVYCDSWEVIDDQLVINNPQYQKPDTTNMEKEIAEKISYILQFGFVNCTDVEVASDGFIATTFDNKVYTAPNGNELVFTNRSIQPANPDEMSKNIYYYTTTLLVIDTLGNDTLRPALQYNDTTNWANTENNIASPLSANPGRTEIAIAPSDPNFIYVIGTNQYNYLDNIYLSIDKGVNWEIIFPGGSSLEIFNGDGCFSNTAAVFPDNPNKIIVGGLNMWLGKRIEGFPGFYDWGSGPISYYFYFQTDPSYLPLGHHKYVFQPGSNNKIAIATNLGVSTGVFSSEGASFTRIIKNLNITQFYTVGVSGFKHELLGGAQGDGIQYISGHGNTEMTAEKFIIGDVSGGACAISLINENAFFFGFGNEKYHIYRSEDKGENPSFNFILEGENLFIPVFSLWESFNELLSKDSVMYYAKKDYYEGDLIIGRSANNDYPFNYILEENLPVGDSIKLQDIVQSKLFIARNNVLWMTRDALKFDKEPEMYEIANTPGFPTCIANSSDANFVFVGTDNGKLYRVSNIAFAYDSLTSSIGASTCIIATDELQIPQFEDRFITSVSVDPQNPAHVIVTLGNYGNEDYVYRTTNALDSITIVTFEDITGNLPKFPVYSSLIEMTHSNIAIIGTECGIYTTDDLGNPEIEWTVENTGTGIIPVFQIKQQTIYKPSFTVYSDNPMIPPLVYPEVKNCGDIYIATYGRGIFRDDTYWTVGINDDNENISSYESSVSVYPNPVSSTATIIYKLSKSSDVHISIYDLTGKLVKSENKIRQEAGKHELNINCSDLNSGAYVIWVFAGNDSGSSKFIVR